MQNEKIVLKSPAPLNDGGKSQTKICIIAMVCGMFLGVLFAIASGIHLMGYILGFGLFGLLVGWGIKNKVLKFKSNMLRTMRFMVDEKPSYPELYQRLLPLFGRLNIKMEMNSNGSICIPYDGLIYDVIYNKDDTFSVHWRQSGFKAFMQQGYYISIYKKAVVAMGIIAYHVQRVCLNEDEAYYVSQAVDVKEKHGFEMVDEVRNVNAIGHENSVESNKIQGVLDIDNPDSAINRYKWLKVLVIIIGILLTFFMFNVFANIYEFIVGIIYDIAEGNYNTTGYYAVMIEDYQCDIGNYSKNDIYHMIEDCYDNYNNRGISDFQDLTGLDAPVYINDYMRNNDEYIGTYVYMEGQVTYCYENIIEILDTPTVAEALQQEIYGYVYGDIPNLYYCADISLLEGIEADDFMIGDYVEVVGMYSGRLRLNDGSYTPAIVAVEVYTYSSGY